MEHSDAWTLVRRGEESEVLSGMYMKLFCFAEESPYPNGSMTLRENHIALWKRIWRKE